MDSLHAPWRMEYILAPKKPVEGGSIFSQIAESDDDESNYVLARGKSCFALLNRYPYNGGHLMIAPYQAIPDWDQLSDQELLELMKMTRACQRALQQVMNPDGFNVGVNLGKVAGAGIAEHLHIHVVPRWNGDTNFMPVIAGAGVLPEALADTAEKLRTALQEILLKEHSA